MGGRGSALAVIAWAALALGTVTDASAENHSAAMREPAHLSPLSPTIVEYTWHLRVPKWVVRPHRIERRVLAPASRVHRFDFSTPEIRTERRSVGSVAEFECKYGDFGLPNACRTTWRRLYVDIPHAVTRHDYVEIDVPTLAWQDWDAVVETPKLEWRDETLTVSLPALARSRGDARE